MRQSCRLMSRSVGNGLLARKTAKCRVGWNPPMSPAVAPIALLTALLARAVHAGGTYRIGPIVRCCVPSADCSAAVSRGVGRRSATRPQQTLSLLDANIRHRCSCAQRSTGVRTAHVAPSLAPSLLRPPAIDRKSRYDGLFLLPADRPLPAHVAPCRRNGRQRLSDTDAQGLAGRADGAGHSVVLIPDLFILPTLQNVLPDCPCAPTRWLRLSCLPPGSTPHAARSSRLH